MKGHWKNCRLYNHNRGNIYALACPEKNRTAYLMEIPGRDMLAGWFALLDDGREYTGLF